MIANRSRAPRRLTVGARVLVALGSLTAVAASPTFAQQAPARPATQPAAAAAPDPSIPAPPGWKLVWHDEFTGTAVDRAKWDFDRGSFIPTGPGQWQPGWGNNELQFYTPRPENAAVEDGVLRIRARKEAYKGSQYTSARLKTKGRFSKQYGRFEFRAKCTTGKGVWPACWMLPEETKYGGWAASGEIDVLEARGQEPTKVLGTLHYGGKWPANVHTGKDYVLPDNGTIAEFHVYAVEWEPGEIRWFVDGKHYQTQNHWWSTSDTNGPNGVEPVDESELNPWPAPFDQPFHLLINLAVGGNFLGSPDAKTPFPAEMQVDYVRVYDKVGGYGPVKPRGAGKMPYEKK